MKPSKATSNQTRRSQLAELRTAGVGSAMPAEGHSRVQACSIMSDRENCLPHIGTHMRASG